MWSASFASLSVLTIKFDRHLKTSAFLTEMFRVLRSNVSQMNFVILLKVLDASLEWVDSRG